jgi:hypothetical protein
VEQELTQLVQM